MRVTIVLPKMVDLPSGGLKVQYESAGALAARGHDVTVVHPMSEFRMIGVRGTLRYARLLYRHRRLGHGVISWFDLSPTVRLRLLPFLAGYLLPKADVTVLTAWQTAEWTTKPRRAAGSIVQVVYDYEFWMSEGPEFKARVAKALSRPDVTLFSPSSAVTTMLREMGRQPAATTPPGIDVEKFGCDVAPEARSPVVGFALRPYVQKAMPVMAQACELILESRPDVTISCYGAGNDLFPSAVVRLGVLDTAGLRAFYNRCQVFVLPSDYEGWGLPAAEAMASGAALVTTANGGAEDFAIDGINALVVARRDPGAIAKSVLRLLEDDTLRFRLARSGLSDSAGWTLPRAAEILEGALLANSARPAVKRRLH